MRKWEKPELYVEEFELSQSVAYGCKTDLGGSVEPGTSITLHLICTNPNDPDKTLTGQGHYHLDEDVMIYDTNENGKIDWNEITAQLDAVARNGKTTGLGHMNTHNGQIIYDGKQYDFNKEMPFNS